MIDYQAADLSSPLHWSLDRPGKMCIRLLFPLRCIPSAPMLTPTPYTPSDQEQWDHQWRNDDDEPDHDVGKSVQDGTQSILSLLDSLR